VANFSHASDIRISKCTKNFAKHVESSNILVKAEYNEFGQLTAYQNKYLVARPILTNRSIVAFVFGQSNAANHAEKLFSSDNCNVLNYSKGNYYFAQDPLLGSDGTAGSPWVLTANKLIKDGLADKVVLIPAAVSGTSVSQWRHGGRLYAMLIDRLEDAKLKGVSPTHFLWHQGESDHPLTKDSLGLEDYKNGMIEIISLTKKYLPDSKFFIAVATRCSDSRPPNHPLQDVQRRLTSLDGVFLGPNTDRIGNDHRVDGCHLSASGIDSHSDGWVSAIKLEAKYIDLKN